SLINRALTKGRVDGIVSSLDKNFMVPVGSAIVYGEQTFVEEVGRIYPGRGGGQGVVDLWCTLMEMGRRGLTTVLLERIKVREHFLKEYKALAKRHGERVLETGDNGISYGMTLGGFGDDWVGMIGSMLFTRCATGARVVKKGERKKIGEHVLEGFGSSTEGYGTSYITAAVGVGMRREEVDGFIKRLDKAMKDVKKKEKKNKKKDDEERGPSPKAEAQDTT
ncbi:hypothetical protein TrRE_jg6548, partial [Triparma retinervis]